MVATSIVIIKDYGVSVLLNQFKTFCTISGSWNVASPNFLATPPPVLVCAEKGRGLIDPDKLKILP